MKQLCVSVAFLLLLALSGCVSSSRFTCDLSEKDSGNILELKTGDTVRIVLKSNPSTGYFWKQDGIPDSDVIRLTSDRFLQTEQGKKLSGAPGTQEFIYQAVGPGETGIRLSYKRPWENNPPAEVFQLKIMIPRKYSFMDRFDKSKYPVRRVDSKGRVAPPLPEGESR